MIPSSMAKPTPSPSSSTSATFNTKANALRIANAIENAIANPRELKKLKIFKNEDLAVLIDRREALRAKAPDNKQPLEMHREFELADCILQTWLNILNLSPEIVNLSKEEAEALKNYLYANLLIVRCKQAATRVTPEAWEGIEERLLKVPGD